MSEDLLNLVLRKKSNKTSSDMAKIQIKSEKLIPFGGIFSIMEQFDSILSSVIDSTLGLRCRSLLSFLHHSTTISWSFSGLATVVRIALMYYIDINSFLNNPEKDWEKSLQKAIDEDIGGEEL